MGNEHVDREEPLAEGRPVLIIPLWIRIAVGAITSLILIGVILTTWNYISAPKDFPSPRDLEVSTLLMFAVTVLILVFIPWEKTGIRIKKIGAVEFERVLSTQADELAEELTELRFRMDELEKVVRGLDETAAFRENFQNIELRELLLKFLREFRPKAFSPVRINKWGARQDGFSELGTYLQSDIRSVLQSLVAEGEAETRISKLGNTLYKISD